MDVGLGVGNTLGNKIDNISAFMELVFWQGRLKIYKWIKINKTISKSEKYLKRKNKIM